MLANNLFVLERSLTPIRSVHRIRCTKYFGTPDPVYQIEMAAFEVNINI